MGKNILHYCIITQNAVPLSNMRGGGAWGLIVNYKCFLVNFSTEDMGTGVRSCIGIQYSSNEHH